MVVTDDPALAEVMRSMRNQGRDTNGTWLRHVRLGFNYRLDELSAAIGVAQVERLAELRAGRARVAAAYERALGGHDWVRLPRAGAGQEVDWFVYVVRLDPSIDRDSLIHGSPSAACQPGHTSSRCTSSRSTRSGSASGRGTFRSPSGSAASTLALPFSSRLPDEDVEYVANALIEAATA